MEGVIIFLSGNIFAGAICWMCYRMLYASRVPEMIETETEIRIKDLQFEIEIVKKKLRITEQQKDIAIEYSKQTLEERNEALLMLSKRL